MEDDETMLHESRRTIRVEIKASGNAPTFMSKASEAGYDIVGHVDDVVKLFDAHPLYGSFDVNSKIKN